MKILITGNLGYVGAAVVRRLREHFKDAYIIGFDTGFYTHDLTDNKFSDRLLNEQHYGDLRDFPSKILDDVNVVVHLAAISNDPMGKEYEAITEAINEEASKNFALECKLRGVTKFVFASSCSVYGFSENGEPLNENSPVNPLTAYAKSKLAMEDYLEKISSPRFHTASLRFATACGMSDRLRLDLVLNDFVLSAVFFGIIKIMSDGTPWRPLINTRDMAGAIIWAIIENDECIKINAGSNKDNYTVLQLAELVKEQIPNTSIIRNSDVQPDKRSYRVDFTQFEERSRLWAPKTTIQETIKELKEGIEKLPLQYISAHGSLKRLNQISLLQNKQLIDKDLYWTNLWK
jgi:nucleoside-diphosphate-sugar epimerase